MPRGSLYKPDIRSNLGLFINHDKSNNYTEKAVVLNHDLMKILIKMVIERLDNVERDDFFDKLEKIEAENVSREVVVIKNEIRVIKRTLTQLHEKATL